MEQIGIVQLLKYKGEIMQIDKILEHSKKLGRIMALSLTLLITGGLSFVAAFKAVDSISIVKELITPWMIVLMAAITFYFSAKVKEGN